MKNAETKEKRFIYYSRTYRYLKVSQWQQIVFMILIILPATVLLFLYYDELTLLMCKISAYMLHFAHEDETKILTGTFIPWLGPVYYIGLDAGLPSYLHIFGNIAFCLIMILFLVKGPGKGRPIAIYLLIQLLVHSMACIYFLLGRELFPYTLQVYSDLYVKQEVGIWITFLVLIGLVMGLMGNGRWIRKIVTVCSIMIYAFVFGVIRYVFFLLILSHFSVLYMPVLFFALGPFFDFMYFVTIYAICANSMIRSYDGKGKGRGDWKWA